MSDTEYTAVVTVASAIHTERGMFETFKAGDFTERTDCFAFHNTTASDGTVQVQKDNLSGIVYL